MVQSRHDRLKDTSRVVTPHPFGEIEDPKLSLSQKRVARAIARRANIDRIFIDALDCEADGLRLDDPAAPRRDGKTRTDETNNDRDDGRYDGSASHRTLPS